MKLEVDLSESVEQQLAEVASRVWQNAMENELERRKFEDWMDLETTCDYLKVSRSNLAKFIKDLEFPVSVINQTKRCNKKKIDAWMAQFEV